LWGTQHAVIKQAMQAGADGAAASPAELSLARFGVAAAAFALPALLSRDRPSASGGVWLAGAELGVWTFAGYAMQAVGLRYTSASRSAFLLYLNVKLVPVFAGALYGRAIAPATWAAASIALLGTVLLGYDGAPLNAGDAWSVAAAAASALFILRLEARAPLAPRALRPARNPRAGGAKSCRAFSFGPAHARALLRHGLRGVRDWRGQGSLSLRRDRAQALAPQHAPAPLNFASMLTVYPCPPTAKSSWRCMCPGPRARTPRFSRTPARTRAHAHARAL
jgi:hypothetical protein